MCSPEQDRTYQYMHVLLQQHIGVRVPERRLKPVGRQLDQKPQRIGEVDRVHEAAILDPTVLDLSLFEPLHRLHEGCLREREGDVVDAARLGGRPTGISGALLVGEDRDQATVTGVEVQMALRRVIEVRLLEHERHAQHAFPEVDQSPLRAGDGDVVHTLWLWNFRIPALPSDVC